MKIEVDTITIRFDIDFPDCENDMVFNEIGAGHLFHPFLTQGAYTEIDKSKLPKTPTSKSVAYCLEYLAGFVCLDSMERKTYQPYNYYKGLEQLNLKFLSWNNLMMSSCHIVVETDLKNFNEDIINKAKQEILTVFKKYLKYYSDDEKTSI